MFGLAPSYTGEMLTRFNTYSLVQMRSLVTAVLVLGLAEFLFFLIARRQLPQPVESTLIDISIFAALGVFTVLMNSVRSVTAFGFIGVGYATTLEWGFLLATGGAGQPVSWVLPAAVLVPVAAGPLWLTRRQFVIGTTLCWGSVFIALWRTSGSYQETIMTVLYSVMSITLAIVLHILFSSYRRRHFALENSLTELASLDGLTRLLNRRSFEERARALIVESESRGQSLSLLYIDIDHFKSLNDNFGHAVGDQTLQAVAKTLSSHVRNADILARLGGEEFALLAISRSRQSASELAARLCFAVNAIERPDGNTSVSIGLAHHINGESIEQLLHRADKAMLRAKRGGRNRIEEEASPLQA